MTSPIPWRWPLKAAAVAMIAGAVSAFHTGCATITRGTKEVLVVESEPGGASVQLSNGMTGMTPTSFKIPRKGAVTVHVSKDGYESAVVQVNTQVAGAGAAGMAGNVLIGGLIGAGIDAASGGMLEHKPNPVRVLLSPVPPKQATPPLPPEGPASPPSEVAASTEEATTPAATPL